MLRARSSLPCSACHNYYNGSPPTSPTGAQLRPPLVLRPNTGPSQSQSQSLGLPHHHSTGQPPVYGKVCVFPAELGYSYAAATGCFFSPQVEAKPLATWNTISTNVKLHGRRFWSPRPRTSLWNNFDSYFPPESDWSCFEYKLGRF